MKRLWAALGFLTLLPMPAAWLPKEEDLEGSVPFFPLVGLLIGISTVGISASFEQIFPPLVLAVILVIWLSVAHRGLHIDGLSDTADGLLSHRSREQILEIMHDSRIGVFGCLAIASDLILKIAALASLSPEQRMKAVLLAPLAGRCAMVPLLDFLPYVRQEGLAAPFCRGRAAWESWVAITALLATAWLLAHWAGVIAGVVTLAALAALAIWYKTKLGGITGDTLGAASEIAETLVLIVLCAQPLSALWGQGGGE